MKWRILKTANKIGDGVAKIFEALSVNTSLTKLDLSS